MKKDREELFFYIIFGMLLGWSFMSNNYNKKEFLDYDELCKLKKDDLLLLLKENEINENYEYCELISKIIKAKYGKLNK